MTFGAKLVNKCTHRGRQKLKLKKIENAFSKRAASAVVGQSGCAQELWKGHVIKDHFHDVIHK